MKRFIIILSMCSLLISYGCNSDKTEEKLNKLLTNIQDSLQVLRTNSSLWQWNASISGADKDFEESVKYNTQMVNYLKDSAIFKELDNFKKNYQKLNIKDSSLFRQLDLIHQSFYVNQASSELLSSIIKKSSELEKIYGSYRAVYNGKELSDNEVEQILKTSKNNKELEAVWNAHKGIGKKVEQGLIELVKLRNELAQSLGFKNYQYMQLKIVGLDADEVTTLLDQLNSITEKSFAELKNVMDEEFAKRYNVNKEDLMPWHYQGRYFQEAPNLYPIDLDKYYKDADLEKLTFDFFNSIGLDVSSIMKNSSLYPQPGKNQHAFCTDINGDGDVRILCNIAPNEQWMGTMLHEFGHGVYALGHDAKENPYIFRDAVSPFTTEAIAMIFGRLSRNASWMQKSLGLSNEEKEAIKENCFKSSRLQQIVFSRWVQVVYRFEKEMYDNPNQDLNALWWNLVEKYQLLKKPKGRNEPDYATKIHIALYPCYYQNYQLGEIFASQIHNYIVKNITHSSNSIDECYIGNKEIGEWMSNNIFKPGLRYEWNNLVERATGEKLTPKYYAEQFNLY